jgi:tetratricopeptide (TPR) repeat protein
MVGLLETGVPMTRGAVDPVPDEAHAELGHIDVRDSCGVLIGSGGVQVNLFVDAAQLRVARSAYLEQVRRIAPPGLRDRDGEMAELARFCLAAEGPSYAWWQAGPWAGKSALLSAFVLRPPREVAEHATIVSFFITARLAAQDTREAFTRVLAEQLAALLGQSLPAVLPETTREAYLLGLLSEAAFGCAAEGRRLVLVVDGLDEDRGVTAGPGAHSIAGLLPADPPAGMQVIVAGRPNPPVPDDVPDWHPLRDPAIIRSLPASPHAREVQRLARAELRVLLDGSGTERDLLGLLAAARGGLTGQDLATLAGIPLWEAEGVVRAAAGRALQSRPSLLNPVARQEVWLLAHEELQAAAADCLGDRLTAYREQLHAWADGYRDRGWPLETPEYLLDGYFRLLADLGDLPRMTGCALDASRHDRMLDLSGGDAAALAEARTTLDRIAAQDAPDLASALALACHRDRLVSRNSRIPTSLPAVWAALGQLARARALTASITSPGRRAVALAEVAGALAGSGYRQAGEAAAHAAEEAAADAEATACAITDPYDRPEAMSKVAGALARAGQYERAEVVARSVTKDFMQSSALSGVAWILAGAGRHERAEAVARTITDEETRAYALAAVAAALARAGQHERAEAVATQAEAAADAITDPPPARLLCAVAGVLARAGRYQRAEAVADSIIDAHFHACALEDR